MSPSPCPAAERQCTRRRWPHAVRPVGTSSFYKRELGFVCRGPLLDGLDAFNTGENGQSSNWGRADAGRYGNADIWAVRLLAMEPGTHRSYGPHGGPSGGKLFSSHAMERLRILGEIPLRKAGGVLDPEGNPDTSFLAKIPADTPFTFQMLDRNGLVLTMAQTWHQLRPGEARWDCGGCHAHSQQPLPFEQTFAATAGYAPVDLTRTTPLTQTARARRRRATGRRRVLPRRLGPPSSEPRRDVPRVRQSCRRPAPTTRATRGTAPATAAR
jgi:hypothetical protein